MITGAEIAHIARPRGIVGIVVQIEMGGGVHAGPGLEVVIAVESGELDVEECAGAEDMGQAEVDDVIGVDLVDGRLGRDGRASSPVRPVVAVILEREANVRFIRQLRGQLDEPAGLLVVLGVGEAGRPIAGVVPLQTGVEPQLVFHDRSAEMEIDIEHGLDGRCNGRPIRGISRIVRRAPEIAGRQDPIVRNAGPFLGSLVVHLDVAGELVSAGLGDQVEDDAGEIAVFGRQPDAHDLGFLDDVVIQEDPGRPAVGVTDTHAVHLPGDPAVGAGAVSDAIVDARG